MSDRRSKLLHHTGGMVLSSFLSPNNEIASFGSFRIPKSFHDEFGRHIPKRLRFKCNSIKWKGKYDRKLKRIYGMERFMKYYEIKIYGAVQFDYYGEGEFRVRVFKNTATETTYRKMSPSKFLKSKKFQKWKKDEYIVDDTSLKYQKASALWSFNAFMDYNDYFEMKISNLDIDAGLPYLRLSKVFEKLYKDWEDGGQVYLRFAETTWEIDVKWIGSTCALGQQWHDFVDDCKLEGGDTLVMFRIPSSESDTVNVCLFKGKEQIIDDGREQNGVSDKSFLKVVTQHFLEERVMFVPKTIKDKYAEKLVCINQLEIFGQRCPVSYNSNGGYLSRFEDMIQRFKLQKKDTVVFTMHESNVLYARIYGFDGTEIDYENRSVEDSDSDSDDDKEMDWVWSLHYNVESDMDEDSGEEEETVENLTVFENLKSVNIFNGRYAPLFVVIMENETMNCGELKLPERFIMECRDRIPHVIKLRLPNGRDIRVNFDQRGNVLYSMSAMFKECRRLFGKIMIFCYEGAGIFLVVVLKEDFCEVDYLDFRTIPRATVYDQDNINGIGWKFLLNATGSGLESGEIEVPRRFCRLFGSTIPENVSFRMSNDTVFRGRYLHASRKITGLSEMFGLDLIEENDSLLFTYCGVGKFHIILFDNGKVEKSVDTIPNVQEAEAADYSNNGEADVEDTNANLIFDAEMNDPDVENMDVNEIDIEMNDLANGFSAVMAKCNVDNTSHGPYIPGHVNPQNRKWFAGEHVTFRSGDRVWDIGVVYPGRLARFSAGWNKFAKDVKVKKNETVVFNLFEDGGGLGFDIAFPLRS